MMVGYVNCEMVEFVGMVYDLLWNKWLLFFDT